MASPLIVVVGHCTSDTARIFCCSAAGAANGTVARIGWRPGSSPRAKMQTQDATLHGAAPFQVGVFDLSRLPAGEAIDYAVDVAPAPGGLATADALGAGPVHRFRLMPKGRPPRVAFVSCNGASHFKPDASKYVVWKKLKDRIDAGEVDLVLHGGDQVYADWIADYLLNQPGHASVTPANTAKVAELASLYRTLYTDTWSVPEVAAVLASVPNVMTWDDHDIYDGYGSHDHDGDTPQQTLFTAARQAYLDFQVSHGPGPLDAASSTLSAWTHGEVGFLLLDTRTNRRWTESRVLGDRQIEVAKAWAAKNARGLKRLYVVSSIPLVHAQVAAALALLRILPGTEEVEDDLRDAWVSSNNRNECQRLAKWLFSVQNEDEKLQVTVLGGDVHVAALAEIRSNLPAHIGNALVTPRIFQVTSSGIGTAPPTGLVRKLMRLALGHDIELGTQDIIGRLVRVNGAKDIVLAQRNFVVLNLEDSSAPGTWEPHGNLRVDYFVENGNDCDRLPQVLNGPG
jgi:PhoD-like phosphatase